MAGPLKMHPYFKSYDDLSRTAGRMQTYLDTNWMLLPDHEKEHIQIMIEKIEQAIRQIPDSYHKSKHYQYKERG